MPNYHLTTLFSITHTLPTATATSASQGGQPPPCDMHARDRRARTPPLRYAPHACLPRIATESDRGWSARNWKMRARCLAPCPTIHLAPLPKMGCCGSELACRAVALVLVAEARAGNRWGAQTETFPVPCYSSTSAPSACRSEPSIRRADLTWVVNWRKGFAEQLPRGQVPVAQHSARQGAAPNASPRAVA